MQKMTKTGNLKTYRHVICVYFTSTSFAEVSLIHDLNHHTINIFKISLIINDEASFGTHFQHG